MVGGSDKQTVKCWRDSIAAVETHLSVGSDRTETSGAALFQTKRKLSETGMTEPGAFLFAAKTIQGEQGVEYLFLYFFEERTRSPLV